MDLCSLIDKRLIVFNFDGQDKEEIIQGVAELMFNSGKIADKVKYVEGVFKRESECSTGIGMGIAIPHCRSDVVTQPCFSLVKLKNEVEWDSFDGKPVSYVIMLAAPNDANNEFLKLLSSLSYNLMDDDFRETLINASSIEEIELLFKEKGEN
ncbi:PTS sugar transporter subunit IIA [Tissierella sp. MSJ-40]|uniref:PTS sugar transporter subunit IIA n=1 Tax=Tissierella simiarum TaxID=2841534 RepID=A0ABS6E2K9_9FIRM|nr:PTS sugar transporter subunit IIA [Tissierella simiarum]MBU5437029.1 PTS sugar transporter subunit IIA [Tissierella simiarum]